MERKKVTPDKWQFSYNVTKRRAGNAPEGSGVPVGTEYHWYILANQNVKKLDANNYTTSMIGLKYKLAHKCADKNNWSSSDNVNATIYLNKNFQIGSDADFTFRQKTDAFTGNNNFVVWNGNVSYEIFKKRNGTFKFEVNDILKQRRGYERTFSSNYIYERNYNTLGRYAMLSFTWNFTKNPGTPSSTK